MDAHLREAWTRLRLSQLEQSCRSGGGVPSGAALVLLGAVGRASAPELALAADALRDDAELGPVAQLLAMRGFLRLGARAHAERHGAQLGQLAGEGLLGRVVRHELAHGPMHSVAPPVLAAELALHAGDVAGARDLAEEALRGAEGQLWAPLVWQEAVPFLTGIQIAACDDASARGVLARFLARFPEADLAPRLAALHATLALALGDREPAARLAQDEASHPRARSHGRELLARAARAPEGALAAAPRAAPIVPGVFVADEGRALLARLTGDATSAARPSSLGGIAEALRGCGVQVARAVVDEPTLSALLAKGARVVLAEERPVGTGFVEVLAHDARVGLLRVARFDRPGAALCSFAEQRQRSAHHGLSALVVWPGNDARSVHSAALGVLDAAEPDVRGADVPRARAAHLTAQALAACPDVPRAHQLHGEALFEQLRAGELETSRADGPLESWYAAARLRFEQAEWAHQIYARCLDQWNASHEAAIAWADALALDEADYRNTLGLSRNRLRQGYLHSARALAAEALGRVPEHVEAWAVLAECALAGGEWALAELCAEALLAVQPDEPGAQRVLGLALEQRGELAAACAVHEAAAGEHDRSGAAALRASLACLRLGRLEEARGHALAAMERDPAAADGYVLASMAFAALGEPDHALGVLAFGLSRVGPAPALAERYAALLAHSPPGDARAQALARAGTLWGEHEPMLLALADALADAGDGEAAAALFEAAHRAGGGGVGARYREARAHVRQGRYAAAEAVLAPLAAHTDNAYLVGLLHGLRQRLGHAPSLDTLRGASPEAQPALSWGMTHRVAERLAEDALGAALEERLFGLPADALIDAARYAAEHALVDDAAHLLALHARHPRPSTDADALYRVHHALSLARADHAEATRLAQAHHTADAAADAGSAELDAALVVASSEAGLGTLTLLATKRLRTIQRGAPPGAGDGVREAVLIAAVAAVRGDEAELAATARRFPRHPALHAVLSHPAFSRFAALQGVQP